MGFRMIGHRSHCGWADSTAVAPVRAEVAYVGLAERDYRAQWPLDALPGYELAYVQAGSLWLWLGEQRLCAGPGDMFVVPPRTFHREETPPDSFTEAIYLGVIVRGASGRTRRFPLPLAPLVHLGPGHVVAQRLRQMRLVEAGRARHRMPGRLAGGIAAEIEGREGGHGGIGRRRRETRDADQPAHPRACRR